MAELTDIRETVRERYAAAATARARATRRHAAGRRLLAGTGAADCSPADETGVFGAALYDDEQPRGRTRGRDRARRWDAVCRPPSPTCARARPSLTSAPAPAPTCSSPPAASAPTGKAIGLDMTDEMLELARANAQQAGVENVEFVKGYLEDLPLADASVDVVISNCVINLSGDKPKVDRAKPRACCAPAAGSRSQT